MQGFSPGQGMMGYDMQAFSPQQEMIGYDMQGFSPEQGMLGLRYARFPSTARDDRATICKISLQSKRCQVTGCNRIWWLSTQDTTRKVCSRPDQGMPGFGPPGRPPGPGMPGFGPPGRPPDQGMPGFGPPGRPPGKECQDLVLQDDHRAKDSRADNKVHHHHHQIPYPLTQVPSYLQ